MRTRSILSGLSFALLTAIASPTDTWSAEMSSARVSDRVLIVTAGSRENNMIVLLSKKGLVIVDTLMSQSFAAEARRIINRELGTDEVRYVVNTHGHWDHVQGNQAFEEGVIIGHASLRDAMLESEEGRKQSLPRIRSRMEQLSRSLEELDSNAEEAERLERSLQYVSRLYADLTGDYELTLPSLGFRGDLTLHLGDLTLRLHTFQGAHSDSDILIHVPEEKMLLVGDVFGRGWLPSYSASGERDPERWLSRLAAVLSEDADIQHVVPSHGEMMTLGELKACVGYLERLWSLVCDHSSKKVTLEQLQEKLSMGTAFPALSEEYESDDGRIERHDQNIRTLWGLATPESCGLPSCDFDALVHHRCQRPCVRWGES